MPLFDRDASKHQDSLVETPVDAPSNASVASGSYADAATSSAHIAELVRRTAEREARPGPSCIAVPGAMAQQDSKPYPPVSAPAAPAAPRAPEPSTRRRGLSLHQPKRQILAVGGAIAALVVAGGFALSSAGGSDANPTSPTTATQHSPAPAGYAVKVTDVVTDCANHSHGETKSSFESENCLRAARSVATGQVNGRPALFVVARITMASPAAATSVKQVLDSTGTGNLNDLLREGRTFPGAPEKMPSSGYASIQTGAVIVVAEAGFVDGGPTSNSTPTLRTAAAQVASLVTAQP